MFSDGIKKTVFRLVFNLFILERARTNENTSFYSTIWLLCEIFSLFFLQNLFSRTLLAVIICALLDKYKRNRGNKLKPRVCVCICVENNNNNNKENSKNNALLYSNNNARTKANHFNSQSISFSMKCTYLRWLIDALSNEMLIAKTKSISLGWLKASRSVGLLHRAHKQLQNNGKMCMSRGHRSVLFDAELSNGLFICIWEYHPFDGTTVDWVRTIQIWIE